MRKLGRNRSDALELLLDTVCSMFGAILLIAILVALMAQTAKVDTAANTAGLEMMQRKIATAEADLAETSRLIAGFAAEPPDTSVALAAEKRKLEATLAAARAQRNQMSAQLQSQVARQTVDFSAEWKKMAAQLRETESKLAEAENEIKATAQNKERLDARAAAIGDQIKDEKKAKVVTLRFPKERARTKHSLPVVCKFAKVYPLMDAEGHKNETTVKWKPKGSDSEQSRPVESLGWTIAGDKPAIDRMLADIPKGEFYITFFVYPDSFDTFRALRDQAAALQIDFGVEFDPPDADLIWGPGGSSPPPL